MKKNLDKPTDTAELRRQAEAKLIARKKRAAALPVTKLDTQRLIHELEVHHIELEMQNEELVKARAEVETLLHQYTDLYDFAPIGYFTLARDGAIHQVNLAGAHLFGVEVGKLIKRRFGVFVSVQSRTIFSAFLEKVFSASGSKETCEVALQKNGSAPLWVHVEAIREDGQREACLAAVVDITERKRAEEKISKSEKQYKNLSNQLEAILDHIPGLVFYKDKKNNFIRVNKYFAQGQGKNKAEFEGKNLTDFYSKEDAEKYYQDDLSVINSGVARLNIEEHWKTDEGLRWVSTSKIPFIDATGEIIGVIGMSLEITERKRAEEALRKNEEKYRGIFENIQDVYYEAAIEGTILEVSPSIEIISKGQYHRDDLIGKPMWDFYADSGERQTLLKLLRERGKVIDFEITLKNRDGSLIPCSISSKIQLNDRGGPEKIIGSMRAIIERKRAEEQIRKDLREKEVMLKEIHHRVRNNLNVITSLLGLQSDHITTKRQARAALEESKNRIYSMALVHSNLYMEDDYSRIDLTSFTKKLTQNLSQVYKKDVEIEVQIENSSLDLNNAVPCGLILNELVTNALKHAFKDKRKGLIKIEFRMLKDNTYELTVQDNGVGLPKEINVPQSKSLGLLIVNQLISQIDGVLKITRGGGTRFQITFPVSAA